MLYTPFTCTLYFSPEPLTQEWLWKLLHTLWQHGLRFSEQTTQEEATWSAELEGSDQRSLWQKGDPNTLPENFSLKDFIRQVARVGAGQTRLWDKEVAMHLILDPAGTVSDDLLTPEQRIGKVRLWMDGGYRSLNSKFVLPPQPSGLEASRLLLPAQQAVYAFSHWCEMLCNVLEPAFAAAYHPGRDKTPDAYSPLAYEVLTRGHLAEPPVGPWLSYVAPRFVTDELLSTAYHKEGCWLKRTYSGGLLLLTPLLDYAYEAGEALHQKQLGDDASFRHNEYERAARHYERARMIFEQIPDENGVLAMKAEVERMHALLDLQQKEAEAKNLPSSISILLDSEVSPKELGEALARDLAIPGHYSPTRQGFFFMRPGGDQRMWLLPRTEEDEEQGSESATRFYRYVLNIPAGNGRWEYKDFSKYVQTMEQKARIAFEALKETRKYRLALLNLDGTVEETFDPSERSSGPSGEVNDER